MISKVLNKILSILSNFAVFARIHERILPIVRVSFPDGTVLRFSCQNSLVKYRLDTFHTKEPGTIKWISGFARDDLFIDIGANIGLYSLFAAKIGAKTISFEPEALNYSALCRNIFFNSFDNMMTAYNIGLSDKSSFGKISVNQYLTGSSLNQVKSDEVAKFKQGVVIATLDNYVESTGNVPNYIKIDVDGNELNILKGSRKTLANSEVKSVLIEIDEFGGDKNEINKILNEAGFIENTRHPLNDEETFVNIIYTRS